MLLALRTEPASDARLIDVVTHNIIKARLVTQYPHGGIVIDGVLYHSTFRYGVHKTTDWTPSRWELRDFGGDDALAIQRFEQREGNPYDLIGLLPFIGIPGSDRDRDFCFELAYFMRTGRQAPKRVTAETLLAMANPPIIA